MNRKANPFLAGCPAALSAFGILIVTMPLFARADTYERGDSGNFSDPKWTDTSTQPPTPDSGPPGSGDTASIFGGSKNTITASSGSVNLLEGTSNFSVTGAFSAKTLDYSGLLMGAGTLTVQTVSGASPSLLTIGGGNLVATTMADDFLVNGGSLKATTYTGKSGTVENGGKVTLLNDQADLNLGVSSGAELTLPALSDSFGQNIAIDGANSLLKTTATLEEDAGSISLSNGAQLEVGNNLNIDGATQGGSTVGGGGSWSDPKTTVTVQRTLAVGLSTGSSSIAIENGATVLANGFFIGQNAGSTGNVTLTGAGTSIQVSSSMGVGSDGSGTLQMQAGGALLLKGKSSLAVGFDKGSQGVLTADGAKTQIDARSAMTGVGVFHGANGRLTLTNGAHLLLGSYASVGEAGNGLIEADSGSQIQVSVAGTGTGQAAGLVIGGAAAGAGDFGALSVQGTGSLFKSAVPVTVARDAGSSGGIGVSGGFALTANLLVGESGAGTINEAGAGKMVIGGVKTTAHFGENAKSSGVVSIQDSGTSLLFNQIAEVYFGVSGLGRLNVTGGASASYTSLTSQKPPEGHLAFGFETGGEGDLFVVGPGSSFVTDANLFIGIEGKGIWAVTKGGKIQTDVVALAEKTGAIGTILIDGAGSNWTNLDNLFMGVDISLATYQPAGTATVTVSHGATMRSGPTLVMSPTATLNATGGQVSIAKGVDSFGSAGSLRIGRGGKLTGKGKVIGQLIVGAGGFFDPGGDPGFFNVQGAYVENAGGELDVEIAGTGAGTTYDQLRVTGAAILGGTLNVTLGNGFKPTATEQFTILTASSISGKFSKVVGADVIYGAKSVIVKPKAAAPTASLNPSTADRSDSVHAVHESVRSIGAAARGRGTSLASGDAVLSPITPATRPPQADFAPPTRFVRVNGASDEHAPDSPESDQGLLALAVSSNGTFTAKFLLDGTAFPFRGSFSAAGAYEQSLTVGGRLLDVDVQLAPSRKGLVSGTIGVDGEIFKTATGRFDYRPDPAP